MPVLNTSNSVSYSGNGSTTVFPIPFKFMQDSDLAVTYTHGVGPPSSWSEGSNYTLTGAGNDAGGQLTALVAPGSGDIITISRTTTLTQPLSLRTQGPFPPASITESLDKAMLVSQDLSARMTLLDGNVAAEVAALQTNITNQIAALNTGGAALASTTSIVAFGGSTPRTLAARFADSFNVKDFGAVGDGVTDDAPAIRLAIAASGNKRLVFPIGTYLLNSFGATFGPNMDFVFDLPSGIHLQGEPGAKLKIANGLIGSSAKAWKGQLFLANGKSDITIENLEVDFNGANNLLSVLPWTCYGLYCVDSSNIVMRRCYWHDTPGKNYVITYGAGATPTPTSSGLTIEDCEFRNGGTSLVGNAQDDFSALYSTNTNTRIQRVLIHYDTRPLGFAGGVEIHASDSQVVNCSIWDSYPGVYITTDVAAGLSGIQVADNDFINCHTAVVLPSATAGSGDYQHIDISGNHVTLLKLPALVSRGFTSDFIMQTRPAGTYGTDWTNYAPVLRYLSVQGNTIESLNGTETDLLTGGITIQSFDKVILQGNHIHGISGIPLSIWGSPFGGRHLRFCNNVCTEFGNHSHVSNPRPGVGLLLTGSSTTPVSAAYAADDIVIEDNLFIRSSLLSNSSVVFTSFDGGTTLTNWVAHNNVESNLSAERLGTTTSATPLTTAHRKMQVVTTTPVTIGRDITHVFVNCGSACTVNLQALPSAGREIVIKDVSGAAGANHITVQTTDPVNSNVEASLSQVVSSNYGAMRLTGDGTNYWIT